MSAQQPSPPRHEADFVIHCQDEQSTAALGIRLATALPNGVVVALIGDLGAGKTRLVRAIAEGCGVPADLVTSPTFTLHHAYHGRRRLDHFDAYRLRDEDEFLQLGVDELLDSSDLILIEWADRVTRCLPRRRLEIRLETTAETGRSFYFRALGGLAWRPDLVVI